MFGLSPTDIKIIKQILANHTEVDKAVIYGSRVKGNYRDGSDIDLTLYGDDLNLEIVNQIKSELDDSVIPYMVDLSIFNQIDNQNLINHIKRIGEVFFESK